MTILRLKTVEARVGVVGLYNSGKTVLITSLINHLQDHDADRFPLGSKETRLRKFTVLPPDRDWDAFNYHGQRDALVNAGKWPARTTDGSQFACQFERSDWKFSDCLLKLYDLPGERVADAGMLGRDFTGWSEKMLALFVNDGGYRECSAPYLDAIKKPGATATELLHAYKLALANLILNFKPLISPSTFLLDTQGSAARPDTAEALAARGSADSTRTAVLPSRPRKPGTEPFESFPRPLRPVRGSAWWSRRSSRSSHVRPWWCWSMSRCCAGGVGMYDDNRQIIRLFDVPRPARKHVFAAQARPDDLLLPHQWRPGWITRVAFDRAEDGPRPPRRPRPHADTAGWPRRTPRTATG